MATPPRFFEDDFYYHVYNRGNRKQQIFLRSGDYERFLEKVIDYKKKFPVEILAFCLMPNHFHFLIKQSAPDMISRFMSNLCNSHSKFFNTKYATVGSLLQGRFKAKKVDKDEYLVHLTRYIHLNPIELFGFSDKVRLFTLLRNYRWSSLSSYLAGDNTSVVNPWFALNFFSKKDPLGDYKNFVIANIHLKVDPTIDNLIFEEE